MRPRRHAESEPQDRPRPRALALVPRRRARGAL